MTTVLISGAGIAGPVLAFWLRRVGITPVVVERAPGIRPGGQSVDLRGAGREVIRRMGLEDAVRAAGTGEEGIAFVGDDGRTRAAIGVETFGGEGFTAELEILRGDLAELLYEATRHDVEYVFDDHVTAIDDRDDGPVRVTLASGAQREVDLVVGADGIGSRTRRLLFGEGGRYPLGMSTAYVTIPRAPGDGAWARWYNAPDGRVVALRPDPHGSTRALLSYLDVPRRWEDLDHEGHVAELRRVFDGAGWETPRVLAALADADDLYVESIGQVRLPSWTSGRVVLVGDAGYCPSPISGMGTTLGVSGAYVLACALAEHSDTADALTAYTDRMLPFVEQAQKLPPGAPRVATPRSRAGIAVLHGVLRVASSRAAGAVLSRFVSPPSDAIELPEEPVAHA